MPRGRLVFPAVNALVAADQKPFPRAVLCTATGPWCGEQAVAHDPAQFAVLVRAREAHRRYCNPYRRAPQ